ncbi:hypothetical protein Rs2_10133 [Raphanus sativus]|nr:hypothetical protein Rs2_10133 [Raphanus sativus]
MQHENQVIMSIGPGVLRQIRCILLCSQKELVKQPDQSVRFLLVCSNILRHMRGLQHFVFKPGEEVCVCKDKNQGVIDRARKLEMIEQGSKSLLKHGKGLQCWVFDPGDDQGSTILQNLDLRTNPFEGREDGVILSRLKLKGLDPWYDTAKTLIKTWLNRKFQGLIGMIYEVLDREKRRTLGTALKQLEQPTETKGNWIRPRVKDKLLSALFWRG